MDIYGNNLEYIKVKKYMKFAVNDTTAVVYMQGQTKVLGNP
jgi:hypothetical protein